MAADTPRRRRLLGFILKIGLSALALTLVFRQIDMASLGSILRQGQWAWFFPAVALIILSKVASAWRLNAFFRCIGLRLRESSNLRLYWLGMYYNLFLPGGIGGDAYKIYLLRQQGQADTRDLVLAALSDRAVGLLALALLALGMGGLLDIPALNTRWAPALILPLTAIAWVVLRWIKRAFLAVFWPALAWSMAVQILQILAVLTLLRLIGQDGPWMGYIFLFLLSSVLTALPISYGGAGAREIAFYFGATYLGLPEAPAVAISLLFYLASLLVSLSGMFYSFRRPELHPV